MPNFYFSSSFYRWRLHAPCRGWVIFFVFFHFVVFDYYSVIDFLIQQVHYFFELNYLNIPGHFQFFVPIQFVFVLFALFVYLSLLLNLKFYFYFLILFYFLLFSWFKGIYFLLLCILFICSLESGSNFNG